MLIAAAPAQVPQSQQLQYVVTDVPIFSGGTLPFSASSINNYGDVCGYGYFGSKPHPFLYSGGVNTDIGRVYSNLPSFSIFYAYGMNNARQVVALTDYNDGYGQHLVGTLYSNGGWRDLSVGYPYAINSSGDFAGHNGTTGFLELVSGADLYYGTNPSRAYDVNDARQIVGTSGGHAMAVFDYKGNPVDIGTLGGTSSTAFAINQAGQITGVAANAEGIGRVFIYDRSAATPMKDLGSLAPSTQGFSINNSGAIAGNFYPSGQPTHAFICLGTSTLLDVNNLVPPSAGVSGIYLESYGKHLNDQGMLAVTGRLNGETHALILTPRSLGTVFSGGVGDLPNGPVNSAVYAVASPASRVPSGAMAAGRGMNAAGSDAMLWTPTDGMKGAGLNTGTVPESQMNGISADGSVAVGYRGATGRGCRLNSSGTVFDLPPLNGHGFTVATAIAGNASYSTGWSGTSDATTQRAVRWASTGTINNALVPLTGGTRCAGMGISNDGSVITGWSEYDSTGKKQAFRWSATDATQQVTALPFAPGDDQSIGYAVSADGSTIVGRTGTASGGAAFYWNAVEGMKKIVDPTGALVDSTAFGVSSDGSVVVGTAAAAGGPVAFVWDKARGLRPLQIVIGSDYDPAAKFGEYGVDFPGWTLTKANAISPDATLVGGEGIDLHGNTQGWVAQLNSRTYRFMSAEKYSGFHTLRLGGFGSEAALLDGTAGGTSGTFRTVTVAMQPTSAVAIPPANGYRSDIANLTGTGGDTVVVQMSYDASVAGSVSLGWFNGSAWVNAVSGNSGGTAVQVNGPYDFNPTPGRYGVDTVKHVAWAVLNHEGQFTVLQLAAPPLVTTLNAGDLAYNSATLRASVVPRTATTTVHFEYGLDSNYGQTTADQILPAGDLAVAVQAPISGLLPNRTCHFRCVASNASGVAYGGDVSLATPLATQTIDLPAIPTHFVGDAPLVLPANASSGLPISYQLLSGSASLSGNVLTITGAGVVQLRASQLGNSAYSAAADVERTFVVFSSSGNGGGQFIALGFLAGGLPESAVAGVSDGGTVVVGRARRGDGSLAPVRWTPQSSTVVDLGDLPGGGADGEALAVSADGGVVATYGNSTAGQVGGRWTLGSGLEEIGYLAGAATVNTTARGLSADGRVLVGSGATANGMEAFRWTPAGGFALLGTLPSNLNAGFANAASADGTVVVGSLGNSAQQTSTAFRWTQQTGFALLGDLPNGDARSVAYGVSADGSVVVGDGSTSNGATTYSAGFRWTAVGAGLVQLPGLAGGTGETHARGVSADGAIIVGSAVTANGLEAVLWELDQAPRTVTEKLTTDFSLGGALAGWKLTEATAISPDGYAIAGNGLDPNGHPSAWLARLPRRSYFSFGQAAYTVTEGAGSVTLNVTKTAGTAADVTVTVAPGTATPVLDGVGDYSFSPSVQTLHFESQQSSQPMTIAIKDDRFAEPDETFSVALGNPTNGAGLLGAGAVVTITDNDQGATGPLSQAPDAAPSTQGALRIVLTPPTGALLADVGWRLQGETEWRASGDTATGLTVGEYVVEFKPVQVNSSLPPVPSPQVVTITGATTLTVPVDYASAVQAGTGLITVNLEPVEVAGPNVTPSLRAQWRFLGEPDAFWRDSGVTVPGLPAGAYVIEFKPFSGRARVPNRSVLIGASDTALVVTAFYERPDLPVGALPTVLTLNAATAQEPYCYAGQVQTDLGFGSGVVARERTVLTAAHVVFDDVKLSFAASPVPDANASDYTASGILWRFQRMRGQLEPVPIPARGAYVLSGYAATRRAQEPGQSTQQSRERDVAALYFFERAGRGGFANPLVSDATHDWLALARRKILVGYPRDLDRIATNQLDLMFATAPQLAGFARTGSGSAVYRTTDFAGLAGCSGGPVCVQWDDGHYYPAGVYLGGNQETLVHTIDANVVALLDSAEQSAEDNGQDHTSGGSVRISSVISAGSVTIGKLRVTFTPAVAGAKWKLTTESDSAYRDATGFVGLTAGSGYTVTFASVAGYAKPPDFPINIPNGDGLVLSATYRRLPFITTDTLPDALAGQAYAATIAVSLNVISFDAPALAPLGLALDAMGHLTGTIPSDKAGLYPVSITAHTAGGDVTKTLILTVQKTGVLVVSYDARYGKVTGSPAVSPGSNFVAQGKPITLHAMPQTPAAIFAGWSMTRLTPVASTNPTYLFTMPEFAVATASFIPNPFLNLVGNYTGVIRPTGSLTLATAGLLTVKVTNIGQFTGKLALGFASYSFKGQLLADGTSLPITIKRTGQGDLVIAPLALDLTGGTEQMTGSLAVDGSTIAFALDRAVFNPTSNPCPQAGVYTVAFQRDAARLAEAFPAGHGFGTITVKADGTVRFTGVAGDGGAVSQSSVISKRATWPFFAVLPVKRGALDGELSFRPVLNVSDLDGSLGWAKPMMGSATTTYPAGFTGQTAVIGARYDRSRPLLSGHLSIGAGFVGAVADAPFTVDASGRISASDKWTLKCVQGTGLFSGSFPDPVNAKPRAFRGALLQTSSAGYGNFTGNALPAPAVGLSTGYVELRTP